MELRIPVTGLAKKLSEVLDRIRYRGDSFLVERNGAPVARILRLPSKAGASVAEGLRAWREAEEADCRFADDLERVYRADRVPTNPWA